MIQQFQDMYPREVKSICQRDICTPTLTEALFPKANFSVPQLTNG